ncbi:hypothetical protein AGDE_13426 [Angomonas deanei]|nr:hypothetical protein AGDE_13426 [Angomonas deanei]|eukprot:EPY22354.1 hypothetical protein AGDE_13426 [Angomonas deanei]
MTSSALTSLAALELRAAASASEAALDASVTAVEVGDGEPSTVSDRSSLVALVPLRAMEYNRDEFTESKSGDGEWFLLLICLRCLSGEKKKKLLY